MKNTLPLPSVFRETLKGGAEMEKPELKLTINASEAIKELSRLNELLYEADALIDSITEKTKNLTVNLSTHR